MSSRRFALVAFLSLLFVAPAAMAWGPLGHRIVAGLAWDQLTPATQAAVRKLLDSESPYITLVSIANWPDKLRDYPDKQQLWEHTHRMHYINFDSSNCDYKPPRQCRHGQCIVAALEHYEAVLGNRSLPASERLKALKFVVHFVGDEHQPLHAGYRKDAGGNFYKVRYFGEKSELHRVWDSSMLDTREMTWKPYVKFLESEGPVTLPATEPGMKPPVQVAETSCRITRRIYPKGHSIGKAYVKKWLPLAEHQLRLGGARLAKVLNRILGN